MCVLSLFLLGTYENQALIALHLPLTEVEPSPVCHSTQLTCVGPPSACASAQVSCQIQVQDPPCASVHERRNCLCQALIQDLIELVKNMARGFPQCRGRKVLGLRLGVTTLTASKAAPASAPLRCKGCTSDVADCERNWAGRGPGRTHQRRRAAPTVGRLEQASASAGGRPDGGRGRGRGGCLCWQCHAARADRGGAAWLPYTQKMGGGRGKARTRK